MQQPVYLCQVTSMQLVLDVVQDLHETLCLYVAGERGSKVECMLIPLTHVRCQLHRLTQQFHHNPHKRLRLSHNS